ncbi:hypothetical protein BC834DRAFT_437604 [Gloeopeniophorella convolvens]|nr:hypothetical protein BC834DRAFT_437604 [Gloeopeniophorella convolvens]
MSSPSPLTPLLSPQVTSAALSGSPLLWRTGALFIATGMMTGAFGTHGLRSKPGVTQDTVSAFMSASQYAVLNGLGLCLISLHPRFAAHRFAGPAIAAGGFIFSSSIMALVLNKERFKSFGPVTPLGGILMIAGYISLAF